MPAITICSDFDPKNKVSHCPVSPSTCHEEMGWDAMIFLFWMLSFKLSFSLSYFTFIKRLFSCSSLSAIMVMSSAYLRLLIFSPTILIPSCASSSPVFLMMYSVYKLNKQGDNIQPWHTLFPFWRGENNINKSDICVYIYIYTYSSCRIVNQLYLTKNKKWIKNKSKIWNQP